MPIYVLDHAAPEIAEDLGINVRTLYHWIAAYKPKAMSKADMSAVNMASENKGLRRELEILRQERDILKKAMGVFAKELR